LKDGKLADGNYCYWEMSRFPNKVFEAVVLTRPSTGAVSESAPAPAFEDDESEYTVPPMVEVRLYFAVGGIVKGYFIPFAVGEQGGEYELRFHSETWHPINPLQIKPSQGFRYFNHEER
jgi:hypothetical protein